VQVKGIRLERDSIRARVIARNIIAIILIVFAYIILFYVTRKTVVLDFLSIDSRGRKTSLIVHYFSKNQNINDTLFYLFYPVHAIVGRGDERVIEQAEGKEELPHNSSVYVRNLDALTSRQIAGFGR
jgi:hypothetical protein